MLITPHLNELNKNVSFEVLGGSDKKLQLAGFNNLTKILSFNMYDFCLTLNEQQKVDYVQYINQKYSAQKIVEISRNICQTIEANVLSISQQDYDPVGASAMVLMSDIKGGGDWDQNVGSAQVSMHLDKSHITTHTYPDISDPNGVCTFRVDIDIATCGEIIPLSAVNYLFDAFECDVVVIDYVVRGFTRLTNGKKIYNDHTVRSIQDFIRPEIKENYKIKADINLPSDNIWQTKLLISDSFGPERYLQEPEDAKKYDLTEKMGYLYDEMKEIFHLIH